MDREGSADEDLPSRPSTRLKTDPRLVLLEIRTRAHTATHQDQQLVQISAREGDQELAGDMED